MFRFNKDMEYALIALVEMTRQQGNALLTARELSKKYAMPYKLLARILQKLSAGGLLEAVQGFGGGYRLAEDSQQVHLGWIIQAVRGEERIADCLTDDGSCAQLDCGCTIRPLIQIFQDRWVRFVKSTTLDEFAHAELSAERR